MMVFGLHDIEQAETSREVEVAVRVHQLHDGTLVVRTATGGELHLRHSTDR